MVFSGQREVNYLLKLLMKRFPAKRENIKFDEKMKRKKRGKMCLENTKIPDEVLDYDEFSFFDMDDDCDDDDEIITFGDDADVFETKFPPLHCLPLYSLLPKHLQRKVFEERSHRVDGSRFLPFYFAF